MREINKILLTFGTIFLIFSSCKKKESVIESDLILNQKIATKIDSIGADHISNGKLMGMSIAIVKEGKTIYENGFGFADSEKTKPITDKSIFLLASISKLIESVMIMKLVEEEKLSLDNTLYELLPEFPNTDQAMNINLRHLLTHTSGLPEYSAEIDSAFVKTKVNPTKEDYFSFFKKNRLLFEPGTNYSYCNSGYLLMGMIIEKVTGNSFQEEVNRIINRPSNLNLKLIAESVNNERTSAYFELNDTLLNPFEHWTWIKGDGGLTATAKELAEFPFIWKNGTIITKQSFNQMIQPIELIDGIVSDYGLGVILGEFEGEPIIGHAGGHKTVKSMMVYFPKKNISIVVLVNTDNTTSNARKIFGEIALAVLNKEIPNLKKDELASNDLKKYVGTYKSHSLKFEDKISIKFDSNDSHLYYNWDNEKGEKMFNIDKGMFWVKNWPLDRITFEFDSIGQVIGLKEYYTGFYSLLRKKEN
jgi:CubicO group peptidase (beta-lactamase class C family)